MMIVDSVSVVRCKDCIYYSKDNKDEERGWCFYFDSTVPASGFCWRGEGKKDRCNT